MGSTQMTQARILAPHAARSPEQVVLAARSGSLLHLNDAASPVARR